MTTTDSLSFSCPLEFKDEHFKANLDVQASFTNLDDDDIYKIVFEVSLVEIDNTILVLKRSFSTIDQVSMWLHPTLLMQLLYSSFADDMPSQTRVKVCANSSVFMGEEFSKQLEEMKQRIEEIRVGHFKKPV